MSRTAFNLPWNVKSPSLARRIVHQFATDEGLDQRTDDHLAFITSELVTNAVVHGIAPIELTVQCADGEVTIEVTDGDAETGSIRPRTTVEATPGGRGLRIVEFLADRWGTRVSQTGKTVWATLKATHALADRRS